MLRAVLRDVRLRLHSKLVSYILLACAAGAYVGILSGGKSARDRVVDTVVYGARLASEGEAAESTTFDPNNGTAAIGIISRSPSHASWEIAPLTKDTSRRRWLYLTADQPLFSGPSGSVTVRVDSKIVGVIRAVAANSGSRFVADRKQQPILMPPGQAFGYRFALGDARSCVDSPCDVSVSGIDSFWLIYRLAVLGDNPRFGAHAAR
jgi:hypothetical protein